MGDVRCVRRPVYENRRIVRWACLVSIVPSVLRGLLDFPKRHKCVIFRTYTQLEFLNGNMPVGMFDIKTSHVVPSTNNSVFGVKFEILILKCFFSN